MTISIGPGIDIGPGISISSSPAPFSPALSLDAGNPASYPGSGATWTDTVGSMAFTLVNGPSKAGNLPIATNDGGGLGGWSSQALSVAYDADIISNYHPGDKITFQDNTTATITGFDNYGPTYIDIFWDTPKTGTIFPITLSGLGISFSPGLGQYGYSTTNLGTLANWSIEAWHYYDGTNTSSGPNIFTEYSYGGGTINLGLGCGGGGDTDLQAWWYGPGFQATDPYTLTPGAWYQIVGTFDGTTLNLYVNNTLVQTATKPPGGDANPAIGYGLMTRWDPGGLWGGQLAILNVYNSDIGASGVTSSWNTNKTRFGL